MDEESFVIETNNEDDWDIVCPDDWEEKLDSEFDFVNFEDIDESITEDLPKIEEKNHNIFEDLECEIINETNLLDSEILGSAYLDHEVQDEEKEKSQAKRKSLKKRNSKTENIIFNENYFAQDTKECHDGEAEEINENIEEMESDSYYSYEFDDAEEEELKMWEIMDNEVSKKHELHMKLINSDLFWEKYDYWDSHPTIPASRRKFKNFKRLQKYKYKRNGWRERKIKFLYA